MNAPPPGWHPDPWSAGSWRWWDGITWTEHASAGAVPTAPGRAGAAPVPQGPLPPPLPTLAAPPASPSSAPGPPGGAAPPGGAGPPGWSSSPPPADGGGLFGGIGRALQSLGGNGGERAAHEHRGRCPLPTQSRSGRQTLRGRILAGLVFALFLVVAMGGLVGGVVDPDSRSSTDDPVDPSLRFALLGVAFVAGGVAVWLWRRRFTVLDTPTVEISGAHPGLCELSGFARPVGDAAMSWFCAAPVIWWEAEVEQRRGSGKNARWVSEWKSSGGSKRFRLVDEHGAEIEVDADGARFDGERQLVSKGIGSRRRITEKALVSGDRLYVLGPVRITGDGRLRVQKRPDPNGPEAGLADVRTRLPLWLMQGEEAGIARTLLIVALAATVVAIAGVAAFTAVEPVQDRFGRTALAVRDEGSLLIPAFTAGGVVAVAFLGGYLWRLWNRLIELRWQAAHAWSLIEVAVTARAGLIANLVATVQAGAAHERTTLVSSATGRGGLPRADGVAAVDGAVAAENRVRATLVARVEAHPDLGAGQLFTQLFEHLVATENRLAASRRFYNDAVTVLADRTATLPGALLKAFVAPEVPPLLAFELHGVAPPAVTPTGP